MIYKQIITGLMKHDMSCKQLLCVCSMISKQTNLLDVCSMICKQTITGRMQHDM